MKRLFLFAGYDKDAIVDDSLLYYLNHLSDLGDIVFVMDSDASETELAKVKQIPNVLYAAAQRHSEYDFGSYKRAYVWARDNNILEKYDWIYLVNDSVLGPLFDLKPIIDDMESHDADLTGIVSYQEDVIANHIQSWFVGVSQQVATADFFDDFMRNVKRENSKPMICAKYEIRLSRNIINQGYKMYTCFDTEKYLSKKCHLLYHKPLESLKLGIPFIKKAVAPQVIHHFLLHQYVNNGDVLTMFQRSVKRTYVPEKTRTFHTPAFRFRIFGLQILKIYRIEEEGFRWPSLESKYKIELFGFLPFGFVHRTKRAK